MPDSMLRSTNVTGGTCRKCGRSNRRPLPPPSEPLTEVRSIGIAGAGTMGSGIAQLACFGGYDTVLQDPDSDALHAGEKRLRTALNAGAEMGRWSEREASEALGRLRTAAEVDRLAACDLAIE